MATIFAQPYYTGLSLSELEFYVSGTLTPATVYADAAMTTPLGASVFADSSGRFPTIYLDDAVEYRLIEKTAAGVTVRDVDPVNTETAAQTTGNITYAPPGGTSQTLSNKLQQVVHIKDFGGVPDAVCTTAGVITGTDSAPAAQAAIAYLAARGGGTLVIEGGAYRANSAIICTTSNITIKIDGNADWYFDGPTPVAPKGHYQAAAFAFVGVETDADYPLYGGTGDYMISAPRPFAAASTIRAGDQSFTASASMTGVLVPGAWIQMCAGHAGWHPAVSEYAQIASVSGATVNLTEPLRYGYSNTTNSLADFCAKHKRAKRPGGSTAPLETWAISGFRRVQPIFNCHITGHGRIIPLRDHAANGYSDFAAFFWCAIGCSIGAVQVMGNSVWALDCQEFKILDTKFGPTYASTSQATPAVLANGSNRVFVSAPPSVGYNFIFEEFIADMTIIHPSVAGGSLQIKAGCRDVLVVGGAIVANVTPGLTIGSDDYTFGTPNLIVDKLNVFAQGSGVAYYTQRLLDAHPSVSPAMIANVEHYYRGDLIVLRDCQIVSTLNASFDMLQQKQALRMDSCTIGDAAAGNISGAVTHVIGGPLAARNGDTALRLGVRSASTLPTFAADFQGQDVINTAGGEGWTCSRFFRDTVQAHISTTVVQVATIANYAVGDVVTVLISNGTFLAAQVGTTVGGSNVVTVASTTGMAIGMAVTGENIPVGTTVAGISSATQFTMSANALYTLTAAEAALVTVGNINREHTAVVTAVNTGASQITLGTAMPAGYTAVTAAGNYIKLTRWTGPIEGSAVYDPGNLVDGAGVTTTVTVNGAVLGDVVVPSFSLDLQGITLTAYVSAANTVSVRFQNETGGAIDLASGTLRCRVIR